MVSLERSRVDEIDAHDGERQILASKLHKRGARRIRQRFGLCAAIKNGRDRLRTFSNSSEGPGT
jgi:hypothetical protein